MNISRPKVIDKNLHDVGNRTCTERIGLGPERFNNFDNSNYSNSIKMINKYFKYFYKIYIKPRHNSVVTLPKFEFLNYFKEYVKIKKYN